MYNEISSSNKVINCDILLKWYISILIEKYEKAIIEPSINYLSNKFIRIILTNNIIFYIYLLNDDYLLVREKVHNSNEYYICDQLEELIILINNYV